jgi:hypothetical protein
MNPHAALLAALDPVTRLVATLDLSDVAAATAALERAFPASFRASVDPLFRAAEAAGTLTPRRATPTLTFGRLAKSLPETADHAIDVVDMEGEGATHTHPRGEVSLCLPRSGDPKFEGCPGGFVVMPPGSRHTPTVTGGRMVIAYWLPGGAIAFG